MPNIEPNGQTIGVVPLVIGSFHGLVPEDTLCRNSILVFGHDHADGWASWEFRVLLRRPIGAPMEGRIEEVVQARIRTAAAATWIVSADVVANVDFPEGDVKVTVQGGLGQTVDWLAWSPGEPPCMVGSFLG